MIEHEQPFESDDFYLTEDTYIHRKECFRKMLLVAILQMIAIAGWSIPVVFIKDYNEWCGNTDWYWITSIILEAFAYVALAIFVSKIYFNLALLTLNLLCIGKL